MLKKTSLQLTKKLNLTRKTNEIKLAEMITSGATQDSPHLVTAYTATLCEDDFDLDTEHDVITPKNELFLKNVEEKCNLEDKDQKERYSDIRNQVLDRVKRLIISSPGRGRRGSISSTGTGGTKRDWDDSDTEILESAPFARPRVVSPLKTE
jgi:hypothetical protein